MTISNSPQPVQTSFVSSVVRSVLGNRFGLLAIAAGVMGLSAYSSWGWLVAVGLAPMLLAIAPCAAMCAFGMCTMGGKSKIGTDVKSDGSADGTGTLLVGSVVSKPDAQATGKGKGDCC